jgi:hypothetical protein
MAANGCQRRVGAVEADAIATKATG